MAIGKLGRGTGHLGAVLGRASNNYAANKRFSSFIFANLSNATTSYTQPARVRAYEPQRTQLVIQNWGTTVLQLGYSPDANQYTIDPVHAVWNITLNPGQEYRENGFSNRMLFLRPNTSGQAGSYSVYHEMNGTIGSGTVVIQNVTSPAIAIPAYKSLGTCTSGIAPIGISKNRAAIYAYATSAKTTLRKSTDSGQTYSQIVGAGTFQNIVGFKELDDGSAVVFSQNSSPGTGFIHRNPNWSTTPATGWNLALTCASQGAPRPIWCQFSFGNEALVPGSGKYGFVAEYGGNPVDETGPCHGYFTSDYGATWTMVFDGLTNALTTGGKQGHTKAATYDPYDHRIYISQDTPSPFQIGPTSAWVFYINVDDINFSNIDVGWSALQIPVEWQGIVTSDFAFSSNSVGPYRDRLVLGSDHQVGQYIFPRLGRRNLGTGFIGADWCNRGNAINTGFMQTRAAADQPVLLTTGTGTNNGQPTGLYIDGSNEGASFTQLWQANDLTAPSLDNVYGPDTNGNIVFNATATGANAFTRGQIVPGVLGQMAQRVFLTGDGATTAFSFPHYISTTPTAKAYPNHAPDAALGDPNVTTDATNITLTFASAPAAGTYQFALRYDVPVAPPPGSHVPTFELLGF